MAAPRHRTTRPPWRLIGVVAVILALVVLVLAGLYGAPDSTDEQAAQAPAGPRAAAPPSQPLPPEPLWTAPHADGDCTATDPCGLYEALEQATEGGVVYLTGPGPYEPVSGPSRPDAVGWTEPVVVTPAPGTDPQAAALTRFTAKQPHLTLSGIAVTANPDEDDNPATPDAALIYQNPLADDFTVVDSLIQSTGIMVRGDRTLIARNLIDGSTADDQAGQQIDGVQVGNGVVDVTIEGNVIRDFRYLDPGGYHPDCIHAFDVRRLVVRWNHLSECGNAGLIFSGGRWGIDGALVEGNYIGGTLEARAGQLVDAAILHNVVTGSAYLAVPKDRPVKVWDEQRTELAGLVVSHNVFDYASYCLPTLDGNIIRAWNPGLCGTYPSGTVDPTGYALPEDTVPAAERLTGWVRDAYAGRDLSGQAWLPALAGWDVPDTDPPLVDPEPPVVDPPAPPVVDPPVVPEPEPPVEPDPPVVDPDDRELEALRVLRAELERLYDEGGHITRAEVRAALDAASLAADGDVTGP